MTEDRIFYTATMARVLAGQGNWEKAADIYRFLLEQDPDNPDLVASLDEAEEHLVRKDPYELMPLISRWVRLQLRVQRIRELHRKRLEIHRDVLRNRRKPIVDPA